MRPHAQMAVAASHSPVQRRAKSPATASPSPVNVLFRRFFEALLARWRAKVEGFPVVHDCPCCFVLIYVHPTHWIFCHKQLLLFFSSYEICVQHVLLEHSLCIEKRPVQSDAMQHHFGKAIAVSIEKGNDSVLQFFIKGRSVL